MKKFLILLLCGFASWSAYGEIIQYGPEAAGGPPTGTAGGSLAGTYPNPSLASEANNTFLGNVSGTAAGAVAISGTQATAALNLFTSSLQGLVPASGGTSNTFLNAAGTFAVPAGTATGTVTSVTFTGDGILDSSTPSTAVTTSGTVTGTALTQAKNVVLAGPASGTNAAPTFRALVGADLAIIEAIGITIDGGGSAITTGTKGYFQVPYNCNITQWSVFGDQSGSVVFDVKRSTYAGFPPTSSLIGTGNAPTLSSAQNNTAAPSGWTSIAITAGDVLLYSVSSAATMTRVNLDLQCTRT